MAKYPSIEQLLPHDKPMILVDRAIDIQVDSIHCQVEIDEHIPFFNYDTKTVPAYVGIEFMAQSIAAWSGYHALIQYQQPPIGFLLGSRRYSSDIEAFTQGQQIDIYAEKIMENDGMAVFSARMEWQERTIATCQLNVYVPSKEKLKEMKIRSQQ